MIKKLIISCLLLSVISSKLCAEHKCFTSISYIWTKEEAQNEVTSIAIYDEAGDQRCVWILDKDQVVDSKIPI